MKTLSVLALFILSFSSFAGTLTNKRTDETLTMTCTEMKGTSCQNYEIVAELKSRTVKRNIPYTKRAYDNTELMIGATYGAYAPIFLGAYSNNPGIMIPAAIIITPATILVGVAYDIIAAPFKVIKKEKIRKTNKNLNVLFKTNKSKKVSKKAFKKVLKALSI
ncbi:MAG: hypothetical protein ACI9QD_000156 [Thermoproteota archaeon]|jgi:hypothetical protein